MDIVFGLAERHVTGSALRVIDIKAFSVWLKRRKNIISVLQTLRGLIPPSFSFLHHIDLREVRFFQLTVRIFYESSVCPPFGHDKFP